MVYNISPKHFVQPHMRRKEVRLPLTIDHCIVYFKDLPQKSSCFTIPKVNAYYMKLYAFLTAKFTTKYDNIQKLHHSLLLCYKI